MSCRTILLSVLIDMRSVFLSTLLVVAGGLVLTDAEVFSCRANFQSGDILKVENNKQYVGSTLYAKDIMCMDMASLGMRCYSLASDTMQIDPAKMVTLSSSGSVGGRGTSDWFFDSNLITDDSVTVSAVMLASPKSVIYNQWTFPRNDWTQKVKTADVSSTLQLTLPYSWSIMSVVGFPIFGGVFRICSMCCFLVACCVIYIHACLCASSVFFFHCFQQTRTENYREICLHTAESNL